MPAAAFAPLVIRFGALGDMVLLTPLLRTLHERYGLPCRILGSGTWLEPLFTHQPDVGRVLRLASRKRPYWLDASQQRLVTLLRAKPPGPVYVCDDYAIDKIRWLLLQAHIPADHCVFAGTDCVLREGEHWIERWHRFGAMSPPAFASTPAAASAPIDTPCLEVDQADRIELSQWLARYPWGNAPLVLLQPGNKRTLKRGRIGGLGDDKHWPRVNWVSLIHALLALRPDAQVILCGSPSEAALLRAIAHATHSARVFAAGGELPLRRLLALCEHADAMISVDTGPAHVAAALGCPLIVLYGAQPPSLWRPRSPVGSCVITLGGPPGCSRVADIAPEEVIRALLRLAGRVPDMPCAA